MYIRKYGIMNKNESILRLRLSTVDCNTSTKYYQLTAEIPEIEKSKIKPYFEYYTPENFEDLNNVAGKTKGWMCKSEDVEKVEKILGIIETRKKQENTLESVQRKTNEQHFTVNNNLKINI